MNAAAWVGEMPNCRWSPRTALDPKHRPQSPDRPSSTVRREWARYPQEAHLLELAERRIRRLQATEIVALQGFRPEWFFSADIRPSDWIRAAGDAVPPPLARALFAGIRNSGVSLAGGHLEIAAGAGGLASGATAMGIETVGLIDAWPTSGRILRANWDPSLVHVRDVRRFDFSLIKHRVSVLSGGPPCQPWSSGGARAGAEDPRDLLGRMDELVALLRPEAFLFENVPGLISGQFGEYFNDLMRRLTTPAEGMRYGTLAAIYNAADFGVPQIRRRVFIVGLKDRGPTDVARLFRDVDASAPSRGRWSTVREILDTSAGGWMKWWY